jgi:hypothetical protein
MQLRLAALAVVVASGRALAQAPSETPVTPAPAPAPAPTPAPAPSGDEPTSDDERDVFTTPPPVDTTAAKSSDGESPTGGGRIGIYSDSDRTTVIRGLASLAKTFGHFSVAGGVVVDAVSSASIDVRSSPALGHVDVVTGASGQSSSSGGTMSDTRYLGTLGGGWKDSDGHAVNLTSAVATERDYASISGGINGSYDVLQRNVTLLGGVTVTDNWVSSVLDMNLHRKMAAVAWTAGVARVLTPSDAIRLRYDGKVSEGYQASPYRVVRFGDWTTSYGAGGQLMFGNTIGSSDGLPELLPETRVSHAATFEWVHSLRLNLGIHPAVRVSHDSWGINTVTPSIDLRLVTTSWRMQFGYRYYRQSRSDFYATKYTNDPSMYSFYTSDKELGSVTGQLGSADFAKTLMDADGPNDVKMMLFFHGEMFSYKYPGFALLSARTSTFLEIGLGWEL